MNLLTNPAIWWLPVLLTILIAFVWVRIIQKTIAGQHSRTKRLLVQFIFCFVVAVLLVVFSGSSPWNKTVLLVAAVGFANGIACLFQWKAIELSLSKTSLFTFGDDIIAISLSFFILKEHRLVTSKMATGIALCLLSAILFSAHAYRKKEPLAIFLYIGIYSVIWGVVIFFERYFAFNKLPVAEFLFGWYGGATIAAVMLNLVYKDRSPGQQIRRAFSFGDYRALGLMSAGIITSLGMCYWAFSIAPQAVVQPILLTAEAVVPTLVGLTIFKEARKFDREEWLYAAIGVGGVIILAFGYKT